MNIVLIESVTATASERLDIGVFIAITSVTAIVSES